jgi:hypothetical protein
VHGIDAGDRVQRARRTTRLRAPARAVIFQDDSRSPARRQRTDRPNIVRIRPPYPVEILGRVASLRTPGLAIPF